MTEEREMLRETVAALVAKHADPAAVRAAMESDRGYDESLWRLLCEQVGAAALVIPEELGGAGGELADAATVLQELGRALVPSPLLGTTLAELALLAAPEPDAETLDGLAEGGSIGALVLDTDYVVNGDIADVVVSATDGQLSRWTRFSAQPVATMDPTRRLARVQPEETVPLGADSGRRRHRRHPACRRADRRRRTLSGTDRRIHQEPSAIRPSDRQLPGTQASDGRSVRHGRRGKGRRGGRMQRAHSHQCGHCAPCRERGALHRGGRRHPTARRDRDHLGTRHAPVFQTRTWQCASAQLAARAAGRLESEVLETS